MKCNKCSIFLKPGWKICPNCATLINRELPIDYVTLPIDIIVTEVNSYGTLSRISIYLFSFFFLLSLLKPIFHPILSLIILLFLILGYIYIKFYYRKQLLADLELQENIEFTALKNKISPTLTTCISAYTKVWITWPDKIQISEHDVPAIQLIIKNETNISINFPLLKELIHEELERQARNKFSDSFLQILESDKHLRLTQKNACLLYQEIFGENMQNINYLYFLLDEHGFSNVSIQSLKNDIQTQYKSDAIQNRANDIKSAIDNKSFILNNYTISDIDHLNGIEFEHFLKKLFERMGYSSLVTKASGDQGADLLLEKCGKRIVVQAKCYSNKVDNSAIQEAVAAKAYYHYDSAMVVTNSFFTKSALGLALANNVELVDRNKLSDLMAIHNIYRNLAE